MLDQVVMILRQDRHQEVFLLLFDLFDQEPLIVSLDERLTTLSAGLLKALGKGASVVER